MSWVDCGTAPSARPTVTATRAPLSTRERLSAANGRTHQTYHGTVQASVRTVASITAPAAPTSRSRRWATAADAASTTTTRTTRAAAGAWDHTAHEYAVGRRAHPRGPPARAGREPGEVGRAQRCHEPVLQA